MARPSLLKELLAAMRNTQLIAAATFRRGEAAAERQRCEIERLATAASEQSKRLAAIEAQQATLVIGMAELVCAVEEAVLPTTSAAGQTIKHLKELIDEHRKLTIELRRARGEPAHSHLGEQRQVGAAD
jgi:hypothetical protein